VSGAFYGLSARDPARQRDGALAEMLRAMTFGMATPVPRVRERSRRCAFGQLGQLAPEVEPRRVAVRLRICMSLVTKRQVTFY